MDSQICLPKVSDSWGMGFLHLVAANLELQQHHTNAASIQSLLVCTSDSLGGIPPSCRQHAIQ